MARKRRAKDYDNHQPVSAPQPKRTERPRLTVAQAKEDIRKANRQEGNPGILVLAILVVTVFIGFYYHIVALQGMQQLTGGLPMLDHYLSGFEVSDVERLAERMDDDAMVQYNWIHITAGRIFAVMTALSLIAVSFWALRSRAVKWGAVILALGYAALEIWTTVTREAAILDPTEATVTLASSLTIAQWLLLILITIWIIVILILRFVGRNSPGLSSSLDEEREIGGSYQ